MQQYIVCPICGIKLKSLNTHIRYKHNLNKEQFLELYPEWKIFQIPHENHACECEICGKKFKTHSSLGTHMSYKHGHCKYGTHNIRDEYYSNRKEGIKCEICGKKFTNIKQHIELKHNIIWKEYCEKYNYNGDEKYVGESTRKKLSENKKKFYGSEAGKKWKLQNSIRVSGDRNYAKLKSVREKISLSRINNHYENFSGYGINILFKINNRVYHCRSFTEFEIINMLLDNGIDFEYEKLKILYNMNGIRKIHITDILIGNDIYEIKPFSEVQINENNYKGVEKYKIIQEQCKKLNYNFNIVNKNMICKKLNIIKKSSKYYKELLFGMIEKGDVEKITISRSNKTFNTFIENWDKLNYYKDKGIIKIRRY